MFLETSALTGENVEEAFMQCARKILNKIESGTSLSLASVCGFCPVAQQCPLLAGTSKAVVKHCYI